MTKQCCRAYKKFIEEYPDYNVEVRLCAYSAREMVEAKKEFEKYYQVDITKNISDID